MASELESIRFQIAVQRDIVLRAQRKRNELFNRAKQIQEQEGRSQQYWKLRDEEVLQKDIVFDEEKKLRDLEQTEKECLYRKI